MDRVRLRGRKGGGDEGKAWKRKRQFVFHA